MNTYTLSISSTKEDIDSEITLNQIDLFDFTEVTLVDEGTYATDTKILVAHDVDISSQPSGTSMVYKISTHNQAAAKQTIINAVNLGWK